MIDQGKQIPMFVGLAAFQLFFLLLISVTSHYHQFGGSISPFCILSLKLLKPSFFLGLSSHFPSFSIMFPSCSLHLSMVFNHFPWWTPAFSETVALRPLAAGAVRRGAGLGTLQLCGGSHAALGTQAPECETGERIKQWDNINIYWCM